MFLSTLDIFKIGIGPSSSHTMGPMIAAARFLDELRNGVSAGPPARLAASLHGSLAFIGKGHATDRAVILGLLDCRPETLDPDDAERLKAGLRVTGRIQVPGLGEVAFEPDRDLVFDYGPPLPGHANGLILRAFDRDGNSCLSRTYYSIGGGFVLTAEELAADRSSGQAQPWGVPYPFATAAQMLDMAQASGKTIAEMKRANETTSGIADLDARLDRIWTAMTDCIDRGLRKDGILPGGLKVRRRAKGIHDQLVAERGTNLSQPHAANDWLSVYAMAVNE
jgi:L-serine dehydratase